MTDEKLERLNSIIYIILYLLGGFIYLDWLLITNDQSKNPIIKVFWNLVGLRHFQNAYQRYVSAITLFFIHFTGNIVFMVLYAMYGMTCENVVLNLLVNVYPMLVQIYIGFRCYRVVLHRRALSK